MSNFHVALKKVVDDSYDVQIGCGLIDDMIQDIKEGLVGNKKKFAVITDSNVDEVYGRPVLEKILAAGYQGDLFVFAAGEKSKVRQKKRLRMPCWRRGTAVTVVSLQSVVVS